MLTDLVVNPFGAHLPDMVEIARAADHGGIGAIWVTDHFSGAVVDAPWSRDPFVCMGALAAVTERVDIGLLVANVTNRHPIQLASAVNSVQSLAPGRVRLGVGSGAAPGSWFASEHEMIGKHLGDVDERRRLLCDSIGALRAVWGGAESFATDAVGFETATAITDGAPMPHLIIGASAWPTIEVAIDVADGVNIRRTAQLPSQLARLQEAGLDDRFEVSVLDFYDPNTTLGDPPDELIDAGVDRHIVTVWPGRDLDAVRMFRR